MKKAKSLLALLLAVLMLGSSAMAASAANDLEKESNNTIADATLFAVSTTVEGNLNTVDDVDYFKFVADKPGLVTVTFAHETAESASSYFLVSVLGEDSRIFSTAVSAGNSAKEELKFGAKAGTYYVEVKPGNVHSSKNYSVTAAVDINQPTENETNDVSTDATVIKASDASGMHVYEASMTNGDVDYYRFTAPKNGYVNMYLDVYGLQRGALSVSLIAFYGDGVAREKTIATLTRKAGESDVYSDQISIGADRDFYLKVEADSAQTVGGYSVMVYFTASDDSEHEYNNETNLADVVTAAKPLFGSTFDATDVDYYKVTTTKDKNMTVTLKASKYVQGDASWNVTVSTAGNPTVAIENGTRIFNKTGELKIELPQETADTYYIKVTAGSIVNSGRYQISVSETKVEKKQSLWDRIKALDWSLWGDFVQVLKNIPFWEVTVSIFRSFFGRGQ